MRKARRAAAASGCPLPRMAETVSTECRKIDNGYIVSRHHYKSDGTGTHSEVYHPTKPEIAVALSAKRSPEKFSLKKKRARRT